MIITTTAGNKKSKTGAWAYEFLQNCAPFTELLYDKCVYDNDGLPISINKTEILEYITNTNHGQQLLRIECQWYELSKPVDYLDEMRRLMPGLDEFNRGVLNQWSDSNSDHPLGQERVQALMDTIIDPVKITMVDKIYVCKFYRNPEELKRQSHHIVFGMDCSGNVRKDFSTLVGVDVTNSEVVFTMRCNQYSITRFARTVAYILLYMFPNSVLVPERNYTGLPVCEIIAENMGQSRIYHDIKDGQLGVSMVHHLREIMYGDVLRVSIFEHGSKIHDKTIIDEIAGLQTTKSGRIDHNPNGGHDDTLISYLYCRWFIMFCKTKSKYMDLIYFNSRLDNTSEEEVEEMAQYSTDRSAMDFVYGNANNEEIVKNSKRREMNNDFVVNKLKDTIDNVLYNEINQQRHGIGDYINDYDTTSRIRSDEIDIDDIAEEYINDAPQYTGNLDDDDPENIVKKTYVQRDTSNDSVSSSKVLFAWS